MGKVESVDVGSAAGQRQRVIGDLDHSLVVLQCIV